MKYHSGGFYNLQLFTNSLSPMIVVDKLNFIIASNDMVLILIYLIIAHVVFRAFETVKLVFGCGTSIHYNK